MSGRVNVYRASVHGLLSGQVTVQSSYCPVGLLSGRVTAFVHRATVCWKCVLGEVSIGLCNETEAHSKQRQKKVLIQVLLFSQIFCTSVKVRRLNLRQKWIYLRDLWINLMQVTGRKEIAINMGQSIQEWTKSNLWKTAFRKFEEVWSVSTNFTWSILDLVFQN